MRASLSEIAEVARREAVPPELLAAASASGEALVVTSRRGAAPVGIGRGLRAKFACIVGTSSDAPDADAVLRKARIAVECGAAVVHDGSTAGDVRAIRRRLLEAVPAPLAVCHPIGVMAEACHRGERFLDLGEGAFVATALRDIAEGVEVLLLPLGITPELVAAAPGAGRVMPCCSKSGAMLSAWMARGGRDNPYRAHLGEILAAARERGTTLAVVGSFRPGCVHDALDPLQLGELEAMREPVARARAAGVKIMAGSGGHLPADRIGPFVRRQKELLGVPLTLFGPQVTDVSLGYDHVSAAMGQILALLAGADEIFAMTPAEHLRMPDEEDTRQGCVVAALVCHSADLARGRDGERDLALSRAREAGAWAEQLPFAPEERVRAALREAGERGPGCSVCGDACAYRVMDALGGAR